MFAGARNHSGPPAPAQRDEFGREAKPQKPKPSPNKFVDPTSPPVDPAHNIQKPPTLKPAHPSQLYIEDPLICEFMWQENQRKLREQNPQKSDTENDNDNGRTDDKEGYESYRKAYCLNYIRAFFNKHMDDSWFRQRYSPALKRDLQRQEQRRAVDEAARLAKTIQSPEEVSLTADNLMGHRLSCQQPESGISVLMITKIPSDLTDEQVLIGLMEKKEIPEEVTVWPVHDKAPYESRSLCILGPFDIIDRLKNAVRKPDGSPSFPIECSSDPYNRMDIDADGRGGATADGMAVPLRTARVGIRHVNMAPKIVPLSSALSSRTRHASDCEKAKQIANVLDDARNIPADIRLSAVMNRLAHDWSVVDQLDLAVAYLRRVHLRNFYHNVDSSDLWFGDMVSQQNVLYVRIKNAPDDETPEDLLVQSLDQSIERALSPTRDPNIDEEADAIERAMVETERRWLDDHKISDDRGRARCSFHFCKKLFQDSSFLHKHLYKKHGEFLAGERAKCHDASMMKAWDEEPDRPVPDVMVDCGLKFGFRSVPLQTGVVPDVVDPEPSLYQYDEQEKKKEQNKNREETRERKRKPTGGGFVDVDDMKEEKVELPIEDIDITVPTKKKKKKKKLL